MDEIAGSMTGMFHFPNAKAPQLILDPKNGTVVSTTAVPGQQKGR